MNDFHTDPPHIDSSSPMGPDDSSRDEDLSKSSITQSVRNLTSIIVDSPWLERPKLENLNIPHSKSEQLATLFKKLRLADDLIEEDRFSAAEKLLGGIDIDLEVLVPESEREGHPLLSLAHLRRADFHSKRAEHEESSAIYREALEVFRTLPEIDPLLQHKIGAKLGAELVFSGERDEGKQLLSEASEAFERLAPKHPAKKTIQALLEAEKRADKAASDVEKLNQFFPGAEQTIARIKKAAFQPEWPEKPKDDSLKEGNRYVKGLMSLGSSFMLRNDYQQAEKIYKMAFASAAKTSQQHAGHQRTLLVGQVLGGIATLNYRTGDTDTAEVQFKEVLNIYDPYFDSGQLPDTFWIERGRITQKLGDISRQNGSLQDAVEYYEQSLIDIRKGASGPNPIALLSYAHAASCYDSLGNSEKASEYQQQAKKLREILKHLFDGGQ